MEAGNCTCIKLVKVLLKKLQNDLFKVLYVPWITAYEMPEGIEEVSVDANNTPVYIYIICDIVDKIRDFASYANLSMTPDGQGYIGYNKDKNAYIEIKSFKKVVSDAKMRNQIFFKKLGLI